MWFGDLLRYAKSMKPQRFRSPSVSTLVQVSGLVTFALLASCAACAEDLGHGRRVMTWVPPYAANACKERLNESFGGIAMKDGITHVGLQFWNPTEKGGIELVSRFERINDAEISEFCRWGDTNGVRVMLCVYNGTSSGWDWELATSAFDTNRTEFVDALVSETLRLKLDGVDIDFEGKGKLELSRQSFVRFIKELSGRLHAEGMELTVDTFAYKWKRAEPKLVAGDSSPHRRPPCDGLFRDWGRGCRLEVLRIPPRRRRRPCHQTSNRRAKQCCRVAGNPGPKTPRLDCR